MGKKAKEHRKKVEKRNRQNAQARYSMENKLTKMMEQMAKQQDAKPTQSVEVADEVDTTPFEVAAQPMTTGIKGF